MRKAVSFFLVLCLTYTPLVEFATTSGTYVRAAASPQDYPPQDYPPFESFSPEQLDNLLAPIALYPDPLLSQVLLASTFPDQIDEAARWVRASGSYGIDNQPWDVSVKAVSYYPTVLYMMDGKLDWTTTVGQAYVNQSTDVMLAVQRLRQMARSQGNLFTTPQQEVINEGGYIQIVPASPQYIYVPVYEPSVIFFRHAYFGGAWAVGVFSFTAGFLIGSWLNHDFDWRGHRIYYTGWSGGGWIARSRPFVHVTNVYVNNRYTNVYVNRTVVNRNVNYTNINRYNSVHRDVTYNNLSRNVNRNDNRNDNRVPNTNNRPNNEIINRNINTNDQRLNDYRGRQVQGRPTPGSSAPPTPPPPAQPNARPTPAPPRQSDARPTTPAPPPQSNARPSATPPPRSEPHAFGTNESKFDPHAASQRGQASRVEAARPVAPNPTPQAQPQKGRSEAIRPATPNRAPEAKSEKGRSEKSSEKRK
ncbi:MAG: DUF3300 domain-containing protein [Acidobacteriia bacterium]|nr:DUF3300 domain-containing protein [Terriglobia bacterium]